jgi:hypothetical protein
MISDVVFEGASERVFKDFPVLQSGDAPLNHVTNLVDGSVNCLLSWRQSGLARPPLDRSDNPAADIPFVPENVAPGVSRRPLAVIALASWTDPGNGSETCLTRPVNTSQTICVFMPQRRCFPEKYSRWLECSR